MHPKIGLTMPITSDTKNNLHLSTQPRAIERQHPLLLCTHTKTYLSLNTYPISNLLDGYERKS